MKDMMNNEASILPVAGEEEIWVDMTDMGYPRYEISSFGRLKGVKGEILHPRTDKNGYLYTCLYLYENKKSVKKWVKIHRLVCEAFYGKPEGSKNITDHTDRCRINNYYKNLRWVDRKENARNTDRSRKPRYGGKTGLPIILYSRENEPVMRFENVKEAVEFFGVSEQQIRANLAGHRSPFRFGYFRFEEDVLEENLTN
jgi:hypothetical protein